MKFRPIIKLFIFSLILSALGSAICAQDDQRINSRSSESSIQTKMYLRYEVPTSLFRVGEDLTGGGDAAKTVLRNSKLAIRVCSSEPLLFSAARSTTNAFRLANYLVTIGYRKSDIFLLRATDCAGRADVKLFPTEIWGIASTSELPENVENLTYDRLQIKSLGFDPETCPKINFPKSERQLITELKRNPKSVAVVIGYFKERASRLLEARVSQIMKKLQFSHVSKDRYEIATEGWHDDDSACINFEPTEPIILVLSLK